MTDAELLQEALNALEVSTDWDMNATGKQAQSIQVINALRARLAQPEPEPVAWKDAPSKIYLQVCDESDCDQPFDSHIEVSWCQDKINDSDIAYIRADTAPSQREWQGLTEKELVKCIAEAGCFGTVKMTFESGPYHIDRPTLNADKLCRAIEAKLKEKNHG